MILGQDEVRALYRRTAPFYDGTVWMYRLGASAASATARLQLCASVRGMQLSIWVAAPG